MESKTPASQVYHSKDSSQGASVAGNIHTSTGAFALTAYISIWGFSRATA